MKRKKKKLNWADYTSQEFQVFVKEGLMKCEDPTGLFMRLAMKRALQSALEEERSDFLGRDYYKHRDAASAPGRRSGYKPVRFRTAEGAVTVYKPQVRETADTFHSRVLEHFKKNTASLLRLIIENYARGLSTRDVEAEFRDEAGNPLISRTGVSQITDQLWEDYQAFCRRDLSSFDVVYLFIDAVYEPLRASIGVKEAILCAWGVLRNGKKILLHLALGSKESYESCLDFARDMVKRGLRPPLTITTDGAPGMIKALRECFPQTLPIRCWFHGMRNILAKVPDDAQPEVKAYLIAVRDAPTFEAGEARAQEFIRFYQREFPAAVGCFQDDLTARLNHLKLPAEHRKILRTTNLLERLFGEQRRRTKVIPRFFYEKSGLKLVFASLWRSSLSWRSVPMRQQDIEHLYQLSQRLGITPRAPKFNKSSSRLFHLADV